MRDYIHVNDLAEAHVLGLEYLKGGNSVALNLGTGRGSSIREVLSTIKSVTGREVPSRMAPRPARRSARTGRRSKACRKIAELESETFAGRYCCYRLEVGRTTRRFREKVIWSGKKKEAKRYRPSVQEAEGTLR